MNPPTVAVLTADEIQAEVNKMTNWQRSQWARAGYSKRPQDLARFCTAKKAIASWAAT